MQQHLQEYSRGRFFQFQRLTRGNGDLQRWLINSRRQKPGNSTSGPFVGGDADYDIVAAANRTPADEATEALADRLALHIVPSQI
eukprot:6466782-Amphidinium_carterae.3